MSLFTRVFRPKEYNAEIQQQTIEELYNKGKASSGPISKALEEQSFYYRNKEIKDWKNALQQAKSQENPTREALQDVYENILFDTHLSSIIENRVLNVLRSSYGLYSANGILNEELTETIQKPWFRQFIRAAMESVFQGYGVIELAQLERDNPNSKVVSINRKHIRPELCHITERPSDTSGWPYLEKPFANYYIPVGDERSLGILEGIAPIVFAKKQAVSSWTDFVEKFGIPPRYMTVPRGTDSKRKTELLNMMKYMISSAVAVVEEGEMLEVIESKQTDPFKVFMELIRVMNSEMSKKILGQDGTTDSQGTKGTYGSLQVLEGVEQARTDSDKMFLKDLINDQLLPRLELMGFNLQGHRFDWDEMVDLAPDKFVDAVVKLSSIYELDPEQIQNKTGITILGKKVQPSSLSEAEGKTNPKLETEN